MRRGRGADRSAAAGRQYIDLFFANVSVWNEAVEEHVFGLDADVILLAECHLKRGQAERALAPAGRHGWNATIGPAQQSAKSESGSNGGVLAMSHCRWGSTCWPDATDDRGRVGPFHDLVGRSVNIDGISTEVMAAYFECGEGVTGRNGAILSRVEYRTGVGRDPFVLAADFNMSPTEFEEQAGSWLARNEAVVLRPANLAVTCRASMTGSLIDFYVVSQRLAGLVVDVWVDAETPWWPHYGVWLRLAARPSEVMSRQLVRRKAAAPAHAPDLEPTSASPGPRASRPTAAADGGIVGPAPGPPLAPSRVVDKTLLWKAAWSYATAASDSAGGSNGDLTAAALPSPDRPGGAEGAAIARYLDAVGATAESASIGAWYDTWRHALLVYEAAARRSGCYVGERAEDSGTGTAAWSEVETDWFLQAPARPPSTPEVRRRPVLVRTFGKDKGHINGATRGGGGPIESRMLRVMRQWMTAVGRWSRSPDFGRNSTARHVLGLLAKVLCGATPTSARFLASLGPEVRGRLIATLGPAVLSAWRGCATSTDEAAALVDGLLKSSIAAGYERRKRGFDDWLAEALNGGARAAHRHIGKDGQPPPLQLVLTQGTGARRRVISEPDEVANIHAAPWRTRWECGDPQAAASEVSLIRSRRTAQVEDSASYANGLCVEPKVIRAACSTFRKGTSIGCDDLAFTVIAQLPDEALVVLGAIIREVVAHAAVPPSALVNVLSLLGKKGGGSRTIATMPSLYRLILRIGGDDVADWDQEKAGHFDTAVAGSSALRAHILRALEVELASMEELAAAHFLWDMEKFYDVIRIVKLLPRLDAMGYPPALATLGLVAHRAPRLLSTGIGVSDVIDGMGRSIIAGCQQSVSWTRALLHEMVRRLGYIVPGSICYEHVDDLSQVVTARSGPELRSALVAIGTAVGEEVAALDLKLSAKSVLLPRGDPEVELAAKTINAGGICIRTAASGEDLGVQCTGGRRRATGTLRRRITTTAVKAQRLHRLARRNKAAAKLARPGLGPKQSYGHQAMGASPSLVALMRKNFRRASHLGHTRGCTTSTIWWTFSPAADPAIRIPLEQISEWIDLWLAASPQLRQRIRRSWMRNMPRLVRDPDRWKHARGPMAATICTLVELGWKPASPAHWRVDDQLMAVADGAAYAKAHVLARAQEDLIKNIARRANGHPQGKGIGDNIFFDGLRQARRALVKEGEFVAASALELIAIGSCTDPQVDDQHGARNEHYCCRCSGRVLATKYHDYYECPDNAVVDGPVHLMSDATKELLREARAEAASFPCLWFRGIVPAALMETPELPSFGDLRYKATPGFADALAASRKGFSDGSGGAEAVCPRARRVFCGAAAFRRDGEQGGIVAEGFAADVPGRQTVPRAEIWGAALVLCAAPKAGPFELVLDAAYVHRGMGARGELLRSPNGDLWAVLYQLLDNRDGPVTATKVKSHVLDEDAPGILAGRHDVEHVIGNELADAAAETSAALFRGEEQAVSRRIGFIVDKACRIAVRLARIQARIWAVKAGAKVYEMPEQPTIDMEMEDEATVARNIFREIARRGHRLLRTEKGLRCERCGAHRPWARREHWARTTCQPRAAAEQIVKRLRTSVRVQCEAGKADAAERARSDFGTDAALTIPPTVAELHDDETARAPKRHKTCAPLGPAPSAAVRATGVPAADTGDSDFYFGALGIAETDTMRDFFDTGVPGGIKFEGGDVDELMVNDFEYTDAGLAGHHGGSAEAIGKVTLLPASTASSSWEPMRIAGERDKPEAAGGPPVAAFDFDEAEGPLLEEDLDEPPESQDCTMGHAAAFDAPPEEGLVTSTALAVLRADDDDATAVTRRRRLNQKTGPAAAAARGYLQTGSHSATAPLGTKAEAAAAKRRVAEVLRRHRASAAAARASGWAAVHRAPEHASGGAVTEEAHEAPPEAAVPRAWEVHASHEARKAPRAELIFCANCGAWSAGHKARGLTLPCRGPVGHRGNLRLLNLGIAPVRGARIPAAFKSPGTRGTRGGARPAPRAGKRSCWRVS